MHEVLAVARRHGVRVHVDAAYGGFFTLLAGQDGPAGLDPAPWRAISGCDSVVVDPHKHGLQPYGCGAVLFADPGVGRFYLHDSPYTYFTSGELHLGEISLECSRAGAAAAALWLTFQLLPPTPDGLGQVLAAGRRAALDWAALLQTSAILDLYQQPELDIVCYFPARAARSYLGHRRRVRGDTAGRDDRSRASRSSSARCGSPPTRSAAGTPAIAADSDAARILRSVLMKPEHEAFVPRLHARLEQLARQAG